MKNPAHASEVEITIEDLFCAMSKVGLTEVVPKDGSLIQEDLRTQPPILLGSDTTGAGGMVTGRHQFWLGRPNAFLCNTAKATPKLLGDGTSVPRPVETLRRIVEEARGNVFGFDAETPQWKSSASVIYGLVHDHFSQFAENEENKTPAVFGLVQAHELVWSQDGVINYHFDGKSEIESTTVPSQERINGRRVALQMDDRIIVEHPELRRMLESQSDLFDHRFGGILSRAEWQGPSGVTTSRQNLTKVTYTYSVTSYEHDCKFYFNRYQIHPRVADTSWRQKGNDLPIVSGLTLPLVSSDRILDLYRSTRNIVGKSPAFFLLPRAANAATSLALVREGVGFRLPVIRFGRVFLGREEFNKDRVYGIQDVLSFTISEIGRLVEISFHRDYLDGLSGGNAFWKVWMRKNSGMWA